MVGYEENEISAKSQGGTEITKRSIAKLVPKELADECQIIASRVRDINNEKIRIYWQHDLAEDPEVNHLKETNSRNRFHKIIFSSNWQLNEFVTKLGIPQDNKIQVIETPIEPFVSEPKNFDDGTINLIYFSTPQRGLEIAVPVVEKLAEQYPNIHFHVHSSFKIYGWDQADEQFEPLYDRIRNHPNMTYHGFTTQEDMRESLKKAHILAYPSIWRETSCRVLMESMSAGLLCVHPNLAALPDTAGGLTSMYQYLDNKNEHAGIFHAYLEHAINTVKEEEMQNYLKFVKLYADGRFNLPKIAKTWEHVISDLINKYQTVESRKIPSAVFSYRT